MWRGRGSRSGEGPRQLGCGGAGFKPGPTDRTLRSALFSQAGSTMLTQRQCQVRVPASVTWDGPLLSAGAQLSWL